jgi:hypothetical protein
MTKECSNNQMTKPVPHRAFELRTSGFFRHYGLGISHSMEMRLSWGQPLPAGFNQNNAPPRIPVSFVLASAPFTD